MTQVWQTPDRQAHRVGTSQASASSSRLCPAAPKRVAIPLRANVTIGQPVVAGASVAAEVLNHAKADKVIIFKKNRRHNYRRKRGHRQQLTALKITNIKAA